MLRTLPDAYVETVITDPPYGLAFMGKAWDYQLPPVEVWRECLRVAKPGAMLLAFGGTRTFHRLACSIEDAGWELRDTLSWLYGSGFPKSHDISKALDRAAGAERQVIGEKPGMPCGGFGKNAYGPWAKQTSNPLTAPATDLARQWDGYGTALKPAWEPIILAMKPCDGSFARNAERHGVAGFDIDACRIPVSPDDQVHGAVWTSRPSRIRGGTCGFVTNQKDGSRNEATAGQLGRWPANVLLDPETARLLDGASRFFYVAKPSPAERNHGLEDFPEEQTTGGGGLTSVGDAYGSVKAKQQNFHPTVKPVALMEYLCRLTRTPKGGTVLDPFCGSGTTGIAARRTERQFLGIELDPKFAAIARARIDEAMPLDLFEDGTL